MGPSRCNRKAHLSALHRGVSARSRPSIPGIAAGSGAKATRRQALVPGRGSRPAVAVTSRDDATSRSAFRIVSGRDAPHERDVHVLSHTLNEVNNVIITYS